MLDDAVAYRARDSRPAAERLLIQALDAAASLDAFSERGRIAFRSSTGRMCASCSFSSIDYCMR